MAFCSNCGRELQAEEKFVVVISGICIHQLIYNVCFYLWCIQRQAHNNVWHHHSLVVYVCDACLGLPLQCIPSHIRRRRQSYHISAITE